MTAIELPQSQRPVIDKDTGIALGVVIAFVGALATLGMWMNGKFEGIESAVVKIEHRLERLEDRQSDRWTATDMRIWETVLTRENPTIRPPGVGVIVRDRPSEK